MEAGMGICRGCQVHSHSLSIPSILPTHLPTRPPTRPPTHLQLEHVFLAPERHDAVSQQVLAPDQFESCQQALQPAGSGMSHGPTSVRVIMLGVPSCTPSWLAGWLALSGGSVCQAEGNSMPVWRLWPRHHGSPPPAHMQCAACRLAWQNRRPLAQNL